jgi:hypothetical protein
MKLKKNINYNTRKIHRYLGVFIGIQFLLWTVGGIYFSWNNMDDVHGETLLNQEKVYFEHVDFSIVQQGIDQLRTTKFIDSVHSLDIIELLGKPVARYRYFEEGKLQVQLIDARNGTLKDPLSGEECLLVVKNKLLTEIPILKATYYGMHTTDAHHEYRNKPLPAYAFLLDHPTETTVYVATNLGEITSVRNNNWRRFDFLWMLHTMDYETRDHITNWLLRIFSILGILTIFSGFFLFYITSPTLRKVKRKSGK